MKKSKPKKMTLHRETLQRLDPDELWWIHGATWLGAPTVRQAAVFGDLLSRRRPA